MLGVGRGKQTRREDKERDKRFSWAWLPLQLPRAWPGPVSPVQTDTHWAQPRAQFSGQTLHHRKLP